ncbi:MAG: protein-(glutamine-N5) methyltransferase, release factor-specific, partial [Hyphomicrobium sp.]
CNPPYIRTAVIAELDPEVRDFDPRAALDGGGDGLDIYRRMAPRLAALVPNGWVLFEVGYDQADAVADLLASATDGRNSPRISLHRDVAGMTRCVAYRSRA